MELTAKGRQILDKLVSRIREKFHAEKIILFGSAARGELTPDSDIDLLVVLPESNWEIQKGVIDLCYDAFLDSDMYFSPTFFSVDELRAGPLTESPLVLSAMREGQIL